MRIDVLMVASRNLQAFPGALPMGEARHSETGESLYVFAKPVEAGDDSRGYYMTWALTGESGPFRHYKGKVYWLLGLVYWPEVDDFLAWYVPKYENAGLAPALRPWMMWGEVVEVDGQQVPRFAPIPT